MSNCCLRGHSPMLCKRLVVRKLLRHRTMVVQLCVHRFGAPFVLRPLVWRVSRCTYVSPAPRFIRLILRTSIDERAGSWSSHTSAGSVRCSDGRSMGVPTLHAVSVTLESASSHKQGAAPSPRHERLDRHCVVPTSCGPAYDHRTPQWMLYGAQTAA